MSVDTDHPALVLLRDALRLTGDASHIADDVARIAAQAIEGSGYALVKVDEAAVERLRGSLWSTWGHRRQTTDWPSRSQLKLALIAVVRPGDGE